MPKYIVSQQFIDKGNQSDPFFCPVALCLRSSGFPNASVGTKHISLDSVDRPYTSLPTPGPVRRRLNYYDRTGKMKPFEFELQHGGVV